MPNTEEKKDKKPGFVSDAQDLFRKLNGRIEASRMQARQQAAYADQDPAEDDDAPYSPMADVAIAMPEEEKKSDEDLTEEELRDFFDGYLEDSTELEAPVSYDDVHKQVVAGRARTAAPSRADVARNINEAERYVEELTERHAQEGGSDESFSIPACEDTTGGFAVDVRDTQQLNTFAPGTDLPEDLSMEPTRVIHTATEDVPVPELPDDTDMMRAFGLTTEGRVTDETRLFEDVSIDDALLSDDGEAYGGAEPLDRHIKLEEPRGFEYEDASQNASIFAVFKSKYTMEKARLALAAAFALLLGLLENVSAIADIFGNNVNVIAVDWVLAFICAALVFDRIIQAAKDLLRLELTADTVTLAAFVLSVITTGITLFVAPVSGRVYLYNFPFAICVLLTILSAFITLRRDVYSFKIVSSHQPKRSLVPSNEGVNAPEGMYFDGYLGEQERVSTVREADFVHSFFAHRAEKTKQRLLLRIFIPVCLLFSVLFFLVSLLVMDYTLTESLGAMYAAFMMGAPVIAFIAYTYPLYLASRRAYGYHSAIIGDKTHENYEDTAIVAFRDEDAFPVGRAKVKSLKLYADRKIESVMYYASSVYDKLGGPLASVFRQATLNGVISKNVELVEVSCGGVSAMVDGKNIVVGCPEYMEEQCFEIMPDEGDEEHTGNTNKRILYLACDQIVIAKFYVRYTTTADFLYMASRLANMGVGTSIRTADPCIDDGLLAANNLSPEKYPVRVVKGVLPEKAKGDISAKDGGIVSIGTTKELVSTFLLCDRIENVKKIGFILKAVATVLGIAVMLLLLFTGHVTGLLSVFPALYQLFWLIPILIVSRIYI
ncbi:MAG: hypothetical protein IJV98_05605 [Clostridia bacterium]|nr:hypothetical protein [Clostridia bacterium]